MQLPLRVVDTSKVFEALSEPGFVALPAPADCVIAKSLVWAAPDTAVVVYDETGAVRCPVGRVAVAATKLAAVPMTSVVHGCLVHLVSEEILIYCLSHVD
jgi:hypothetical protein